MVPLPAMWKVFSDGYDWVTRFFFSTVEIKICLGMFSKPERGAQWIIILGAQVRGRKITDSLKRRLDAAIHYLEENERDNGSCFRRQAGEDISEADATGTISYRTRSCGNRIRKEDQSVSTRENLSFSRRFIDPKHETVGIVTNNFLKLQGKNLQQNRKDMLMFFSIGFFKLCFSDKLSCERVFLRFWQFLKNKRIL